MAASASTSLSFLLLLALVVVAAGARDGPDYTEPMSTAAGSTQAPASPPEWGVVDESGPFDRRVSAAAGSTQAPASPPDGGVVDESGPLDRRVSAAEGPTTQAPAAAPLEEEAADGGGTVSFDRTVPRDVRRCDSDARWTDQLCRRVCGMYKFHGYEFTQAAADEGQDAAPRCCCCPGGGTCVKL